MGDIPTLTKSLYHDVMSSVSNPDLNDDDSTSAMIALLPITDDWCKLDLPHLTLVYAGDTAKLPATSFNELAKDAASLAMISSPIMLKVIGVQQFGKDAELVDALALMPTQELWAMRRMVEHWNQSEYTDYKPHCTIGPPGSGAQMDFPPRSLAFNRVLVGWGKDQIVFNMNAPRPSMC